MVGSTKQTLRLEKRDEEGKEEEEEGRRKQDGDARRAQRRAFVFVGLWPTCHQIQRSCCTIRSPSLFLACPHPLPYSGGRDRGRGRRLDSEHRRLRDNGSRWFHHAGLSSHTTQSLFSRWARRRSPGWAGQTRAHSAKRRPHWRGNNVLVALCWYFSTRWWSHEALGQTVQTNNCHSVQPMACYTRSSPYPDWERRQQKQVAPLFPLFPNIPRPPEENPSRENIPSFPHPSSAIHPPSSILKHHRQEKAKNSGRRGQAPDLLVALAVVCNRCDAHWALHLYLWPRLASRFARAVAC